MLFSLGWAVGVAVDAVVYGKYRVTDRPISSQAESSGDTKECVAVDVRCNLGYQSASQRYIDAAS